MNKKITDIKGAIHLLKSRIDIVDVVIADLGQPNKEAGSDILYNCVFHSENTPSLGIHKTMQFWHCFGCKKSGDVVTWVMEYKNISVEEAIRTLAEQYKVDITEFERPLTAEEVEKIRQLEFMNEVGVFCTKQLFANRPILDWYMADSGFNLEQVVDYDVGYCGSPDHIVSHLYSLNKGITQHDVDQLEFTHRFMWTEVIVYPIKDLSDDTYKFHNRIINPPANFAGKYVGTSTKHPLFSNKHLFGLQHLRKKLKDNKGVIRVTEGQKGAIASNGLALMGSTFQPDQIMTLKDAGVKEIRLIFDGDFAGRDASSKMLTSYGLFEHVNLLLGRLPEGTQPDTLVKSQGIAALDKVFAEAVIPVQFYIDGKKDINGLISVEDKFSVIKELKDHLLNISPIQLDITADYLSKELHVDLDNIKNYIADLKLTKSDLFNRDVELSVIQFVLLNPKHWSSLRQAVNDAKAFTVPGYQYVFNALDFCHKAARDIGGAETVTVQTVKDRLSIGFKQYGDLPKIIDAILIVSSKYEFNDALSKLVDLYRRRVGIDQSKMFISYLQDLGKPTGDIVSSYRRGLVSSLDIRKNEYNTPNQLAKHLALELQERSLRKSAIVGHDFSCLKDVDGQKIKCMTGLTLALSGLQKQHQVIISANSGVGKSLIALQMATSLSICPDLDDRVPILWIPLEMNATETLMRVASQISGVDNNKIQNMNLNDEESRKVRRAIEMINEGKLYVKKPKDGHIDEIFAIIDEYRFKYGIEAVFLDYLQLIGAAPADKGNSREEVIGRASKVMKNQVAEALGITSVCIAQQNRMNFKAGEVSKIESVGGSYQIAQDADDFITLAEKTKEQMEVEKGSRGNRKIFLDKRRGGASDVMLDMYLDVNDKFNLRFMETITPGELLGLSRGMKSDT